MSIKSFAEIISSSFLAALLLGASGCGDEPSAAQPGPAAGMNPIGAGAAPGEADAGPLGDSPTVKQIMGKLTRGPGSLTPVIAHELNVDPPAWDTIQPQTREYARLAAAMGKNDPPRGSMESWSQLTAAFASSAEALNKAAEAKDRDAALEAHEAITGSCMSCHREHRRGGAGMAGPGMGGPGMGGPGRGGPPIGRQGRRPQGQIPKGAAAPGG
jgi:hypothetical protein